MKRAAFALLFLAAGTLFAEDGKILSCELIPAHRSKGGILYKLWITNISQEPVSLCGEPRYSGRSISWDRTDTYWSSANAARGPAGLYPAFCAVIARTDGKSEQLGAETIRNAIQNPTGNEDSFCTLAPGESISCQDPMFPDKPQQAEFLFLQIEQGKARPVKVAWRADQPPARTWTVATGFPVPKTEAGRMRLYDVPLSLFENRELPLPRLEQRRGVFDLKAWCTQNGLVAAEIDFAFYDWRTGLCLIATSEANHQKLKDLQFQ